ncbi:MAG: hypothetical protein ACWA6X_03575 [Bauldia sp.]
MAAPENTLTLLRRMRTTLNRLDRLEKSIDRNQVDVRSRLDGIGRALDRRSVLGRYAAAAVEERLDAIEKRLLSLESRR